MPYLKLSRARRSAYESSGDPPEHEYGPIFGPFPCFHVRPDRSIEFGGEPTFRLHLLKGFVFYAGTYYAGWSVFTGPPVSDEAVHLVPFDPAQADPPDPRSPCDCELPGGEFFCGVPGILAHLEDGGVSADFRVERCDLCRRYPSDAAARRKLQELGLIAEPEPNLPTFTVECHAVVRVTVRDVPASDLRAAAREARGMFEWYRFRKDAMFDGEFRRFIVSPESVLPGETRIRPVRQFHAELIDLQLPA